MKLAAVAFCALLVAGCLASPPRATPSDAGFWLAFQACLRGCIEPEDNQTYLAWSPDGASWSLAPGYTPYRGTSPDPIRRNDTVSIFTTPGFVRRYHVSTGVADPRNSTGAGAVGRDPDVDSQMSMVLGDDGLLAMFYLVGKPFAVDPGTCDEGEATCVRIVRSATEEPRADRGGGFWMDDGDRASFRVTAPGRASDPDVFADPRGFVMLVTTGSGVVTLRSATLRGDYTPVDALPDGLLVRAPGFGPVAGVFDGGAYSIFASDARGNITRAVVRSLDAPIDARAFAPVLAPGSLPGLGAEYALKDPGVALDAR